MKIPYSTPSQMEPLLPRTDGELTALALELLAAAETLNPRVHAITRQSLTALLRNMNSYYSNLIEGHRTHPRDIERALQDDFSAQPEQRALQLESKAHVEVEQLVDARLAAEPELNVCSAEFIGWMHREFYARMPAEFLTAKSGHAGRAAQVTPGALRETEVSVGAHLPPTHASLPQFLARFAEFYNPAKLGPVERIVAAAASHHRLAWIHPFLDGNGRVTRLFSHAYFARAGVNGHGLWTISRALARNRTEYMSKLAYADSPRMGDLDGRGNLSEKALAEFCRFFLSAALDQVRFMSGLLDFDQLKTNIAVHVSRRKLKPAVAFLLSDLVFRGELPRGDAGKLLNLSPSQARTYLRKLLEEGLLRSESPKGPVRLGFTIAVATDYFPRLYVPDSE